MSTNATVEVVHSRWVGSDGDTVVFDLPGGTHQVDLSSHPAAAALVAGAVSAGSLRLKESDVDLAQHVESDEDSLAWQAKVEEIRQELLPARDEAIDSRVAELRAEATSLQVEASENDEDVKLQERARKFVQGLGEAIAEIHDEEIDAYEQRVLDAIAERLER